MAVGAIRNFSCERVEVHAALKSRIILHQRNQIGELEVRAIIGPREPGIVVPLPELISELERVFALH